MFKEDDVTNSVEKIALQQFQSIQDGYKSYAEARKQEQGRALGEAMFKMSHSNHQDPEEVHDVSNSPEQTEQEPAPSEDEGTETGRENLDAKMQQAMSDDNEEEQQSDKPAASVNGKRQSPSGVTGHSPARSKLKTRGAATQIVVPEGTKALSKAEQRKLRNQQKQLAKQAEAQQAKVSMAFKKPSNYHELITTPLFYLSTSTFPHPLQNTGSGRGSKNG